MPICRILLVLLAVATLPASEALVHVVRKGENLTTIAKSYGVTVDSVKKANNLRNADKIVVGQKLEIPGTATKYIEYKVRKGESLSSIAAQHGLEAKEIGSFNGIRNLNKIRVGQVIRIPSKFVQRRDHFRIATKWLAGCILEEWLEIIMEHRCLWKRRGSSKIFI